MKKKAADPERIAVAEQAMKKFRMEAFYEWSE